MRLFVLARHGESELNLTHRINGDPGVPVHLTETGREQSRALALQLSHIVLDACIVTRFGRTRETAEIALDGRGVLIVEEPLLDDIDVGDLEGQTVEDYRSWKRAHTRADPFPGGESLDNAAQRYGRGFARVLELPYDCVLVVCHEIPVRYALNAACGSDQLDRPVHAIGNAVPYLFDENALRRAAGRIQKLAGTR